MALWTRWLEETLLAREVPHRQVVLTISKRLRAWCLYRRPLLGNIASANWHPHIHMMATDGSFRPDGTIVPWPAPAPRDRD